jgi:hypothetical protein
MLDGDIYYFNLFFFADRPRDVMEVTSMSISH